ncbi:MAG: cell division protein FtsA [Smithellaceae bacterium]|nr:cell division protein FtsA [Smithellaceae bacterium]
MKRKNKNYVAGLDIGTTKVSAVVGQPSADGVEILGFGTAASDGSRRGVVVNIESTIEAIRSAVEEAERSSGCNIRAVYASVAGDHIRGQNSQGIGAVKGDDITEEDVQEAIEAAKAIAIPKDRQILDCLPQSFVVDGHDEIDNPIGMTGVRLEVRAYVITCAVAAIHNITKATSRMGLELIDVVLQQLATSASVLSNDERDLGVGLIDIGGETTDIAIFYKGCIRHISTLPLGGRYITSDIATGLRTPMTEAEKIKVNYGCAHLPLINGDEMIEVPSVGGREPREVSRHVLVRIVEPRVQEILSMAAKEISRAGYDDLLAAGVVITGGTALIGGIDQLAEQVFNMPARQGYPQVRVIDEGVIVDPSNATGAGLVLYGCENMKKGRFIRPQSGYLMRFIRLFNRKLF